MKISLSWSLSELGSVIHTANRIRRGFPIVDQKLARSMSEPISRVAATSRSVKLDDGVIWQMMLASACHLEGPEQMVAAVAEQINGATELTGFRLALSESVATLAERMDEALPNWRRQLTQRQRPLREQWDARGPGVLAEICRHLGEEPKAVAVRVFIVHPVSGGGGGVHPGHNSIRVEGVLTNNVPELPEVVRMAWWLAQLGFCQPDQLSGSGPRPDSAAPLALLMATLAAAATAELVRFDDATLAAAFSNWELPASHNQPLVSVSKHWWAEYKRSGLAWADAVAQLAGLIDDY